jgi:aryl-alcohol dehydrogenase-like predicted oxidoreductase
MALATASLGRTGLEISTLGVGTWAIGGRWKMGCGPQDDVDSLAALREALALGVTWLDTAPVYGLGHAEEVVGALLREIPVADRPLVFTKCGLLWSEAGEPMRIATPSSIREECEQSLRRLGLEALDALMIHWPPLDTPVEEAWSAVAALVDEGLVRFAGASNFSVDELRRCEAIRHVDIVQPGLSLLDRASLDDVIPWCHERDTGVLAYSAMQSGLLTGTWTHERLAALDAEDWRHSSPPFQGEAFERNLAFVERARSIAESIGCAVSELAVAWVLAQDGVDVALVGTRRSGQAAAWSKAADVQLSESDLKEIDRALAETGAGQGPGIPGVA